MHTANRYLALMMLATVLSTAMLRAFAQSQDSQKGVDGRNDTKSSVQIIVNPLQTIVNPRTPEDKAMHERLEALIRPASDASITAEELFNKGDLVGAEAAAMKSVRLSPKTRDGSPLIPSGLEVIGEIRLLQGKPDQARNFFLACGPDYASQRRDLGLTIAYCRLGDYRNALTGYRYAATMHAHDEFLDEKDPDRPGYRNVREIEASVLLAKAQRFHGFLRNYGEAELTAAEKLLPDNAMVAYELAKVLRENKKYAEAMTRFNKAARYGHGDLAKQAKNHAETVDAFMKQQAQKLKQTGIRAPGQ